MIFSENRYPLFRHMRWWSTRMSGIAEPSSKPHGKRDERTDKQAFTQVEKWMAMIREIDQQRQTERERMD
jgi:hypothetical protein